MASFATLPTELQSDIVELALPHHLCWSQRHGHHHGISPAAANNNTISAFKTAASNIVLACPSAINVVVRGCRKRCAKWRKTISTLPKPEDLCVHAGPCDEEKFQWGTACQEYKRAKRQDEDHLRLPAALEGLCLQMERLAGKLDDTRAQTTKLTRQRLGVSRARAAKTVKQKLRRASLKNARAAKAAKQRLRRAALKQAQSGKAANDDHTCDQIAGLSCYHTRSKGLKDI